MIPMIVTLSLDDRRRMARVFRAALRHLDGTGRSLDSAAREASDDRERPLDVRQFARELEGVQGSLPNLWKQGVDYLQWLAVEIASEFGVPKETRRAMLLRRASVTRKAMARADLRAGQKERVG